MITLEGVKQNKQILSFIKKSKETLAALSYTDHGLRHLNLVADRAKKIAKEIGLKERDQELSSIAAFCHDMANFLSRPLHNYFASLLFFEVYKDDFDTDEIATIMQAISNHDKQEEDIIFISNVAAIVVLADKSDVHRSRVTVKNMREIEEDIHDRVNYATTYSSLETNKTKKTITLNLKIDTKFCSILEYFEIFTDRMIFCRLAAEFLGYKFKLVINTTELL